MSGAIRRGVACSLWALLLAMLVAVLCACRLSGAGTDVSGDDAVQSAPALSGDPKPVQLSAAGYVQDGKRVAFAFVVDNPNLTLAAERASYLVTLYDASGNVLVSAVKPLGLLLPLQRLGVASEAAVPNGESVARLDIALSPGALHPLPDLPLVPTGCVCSDHQIPLPFSVEDAVYAPAPSGGMVTGTVVSPYLRDARDVGVAAIAYDTGGQIIGSGFISVSLVPANGQVAVAVPVTAATMPAKVELFPQLSSLANFN